MAEREGFEPSEGYKPSHDFESCAFNRSATSPNWSQCGRFLAGMPKPGRSAPGLREAGNCTSITDVKGIAGAITVHLGVEADLAFRGKVLCHDPHLADVVTELAQGTQRAAGPLLVEEREGLVEEGKLPTLYPAAARRCRERFLL